MEGNRKLYYVLMAAAVVLLMVSYGVGFMVGKNYGYNNAKKEFEVEKQKLMKTIASLTPLSRPRSEEKVVVVNGNPPSQTNLNATSEKKAPQQSVNSTETKPEEKTSGEKKKQVQVSKVESKPVVKPPAVKGVKKNQKIKKDYFIQLGIFSKRANAEKLVKKLKKAGIPSHISKWKNYYRVTTGTFTEKEAKQVLAKLKKMKLSGIIKKRR
ncbi:SPOR domain-containing protein [Desulfurobacterium sp.]